MFAVLVSSLVLALGLGIVAITMKEVKLSGTGRDSQLAFYASDSGAECAFYWDLKGDYFATSSSGWLISNASCANGQNIEASYDPATQSLLSNPVVSDNLTAATTTFWLYMKGDSGSVTYNSPCAKVQVVKFKSGANQKTSIDSRGYNTCDVNNTRRLERGYRIEY